MQNTGKRCMILLVFIILRWSFNYGSNVFRYNKILIDCVFGNSEFVVPRVVIPPSGIIPKPEKSRGTTDKFFFYFVTVAYAKLQTSGFGYDPPWYLHLYKIKRVISNFSATVYHGECIKLNLHYREPYCKT